MAGLPHNHYAYNQAMDSINAVLVDTSTRLIAPITLPKSKESYQTFFDSKELHMLCMDDATILANLPADIQACSMDYGFARWKTLNFPLCGKLLVFGKTDGQMEMTDVSLHVPAIQEALMFTSKEVATMDYFMAKSFFIANMAIQKAAFSPNKQTARSVSDGK